MKKQLSIIAAALILLISCSKKESTYEVSEVNGIRVTRNTGVPADSTFRIELKEVGFIDNENETDSVKFFKTVLNFVFDDQKNLFIMDRGKNRVHKYDSGLKFVTAFGRNGQGPGEFEYPGYINVRGDTLFIPVARNQKIIKYDLKGNFICDKLIPDRNNFPAYPLKFGNDYISQSIGLRPGKDKGLIKFHNITIYDNKFDFVKHLNYIEYPYDRDAEHDPSEKGFVLAFDDSTLYLSENSKDNFKISVLNREGKKVREIRKNYLRTKVSEREAAKYEEIKNKYNVNYKVQYKNSITNMVIDNYGKIWVLVEDSDENGKIIYDIFENDVYLNRIELNFGAGYSPNFVGDKIIALNTDNNNIKIYEY